MSSISRQAYRAAIAVGMVLLAGWTGAAAGAEPKSVHVRGSTTMLPMAQYMAEAYMAEQPGVTVAVSDGGTNRGYKSILDGTADVALVSGPLPAELKREMDRRGVRLTSITAAHNAIVPVVHPANPLASLSPEQLKHIFTGRIDDWKSVGWKSAPIKVFVGPPSGGITESWKEAVIGNDGTYTPQGIVLGTAERIRRVAADPLAISFVAFGGINQSVKALQVNHVAASAETVLDGRYLLHSPLMLVTNDKSAAVTRDFVRYFATPRKHLRFPGIITVESVD